MGLKEQVMDDMKTAMKERNEIVKSTLRMARAEVLKIEKSGADVEVGDEEMLAIIARMIKQRKESISHFVKGNRVDLADIERAEIEVLQKYMPESLPIEDIEAAVDAVIADTGASEMKDMGRVMGQVMGKLKQTGKTVDGNAVNATVKARLGG
jgi:uncharacterized protein